MKIPKKHNWEVIKKESQSRIPLEIPHEKLVQFYDYAQELMAFSRYNDAEAVLFVLSLLAPDRPHIWISLGIARGKIEEDSELALLAFDQAILLAPNLVEPYYYAASLAYLKNDKERSLKYLSELLEKGIPQKEDAHLWAAAKLLMEELSHG